MTNSSGRQPFIFPPRHPGESYSFHISTSSTIHCGDILKELDQKSDTMDHDTRILIADVVSLLKNEQFDDSYENISCITPELKPEFIYQCFGHIGMSIEEKNIGDALTRYFLTKDAIYHIIAIVP